MSYFGAQVIAVLTRPLVRRPWLKKKEPKPYFASQRPD
jgi:hypothetical protein